jgi:phage FluMu protein Com
MKALRCLCGSLLANVKKNGIELKCRKCKRVVMIPMSEEAALRVCLFFDHAHQEEKEEENA